MKRVRNWFGVVGLLLVLTGCLGSHLAYQAAREAQSLDATATVVGEHYYALVREAADLKDAGKLQGAVLMRVQAIDKQAKPLVIQMTNVAQSFRAARTAENEAALQEAINQAALSLNAMIEALRSARGT